ncbi:hypothetical protein ACFOWM_05445 [Ferruginibacter yonginensis]|uniref:Outer membrane protein beta-barrel domain-containing protein n=1 Tax=Ferruginibacter yonginensis TaxID=1310416 RepID=A0ABV8QTE5_9BACT
MKKALLAILFISFSLATVTAQSSKDDDDEVSTKGFDKSKLFAGGTVALGFGSGSFNVGVGPYFGYSLNKYLDVAVSLNYNYVSYRDFAELGDKLRQSVIGPGAFIRVYPVKFLFAHAQYEQNFLTSKYIPANNGNFLPSKETRSVGSFLVGPGFANGRYEDGKSFYYFSVLFDVAKNANSPYVDQLGRLTPIIRAGINVALFEYSDRGRKNRRRERF